MEEPVFSHGLRCRLRILHIAHEVVRAPRQDLTVLCDLELDVGKGRTHRTESVLGRTIERAQARALGLAVDIEKLHSETGEELRNLRRERCGRREQEPGLIKPHSLFRFRVDQLVEQPVLHSEPAIRSLSSISGVGVLPAYGNSSAHNCLLDTGGCA